MTASFRYVPHSESGVRHVIVTRPFKVEWASSEAELQPRPIHIIDEWTQFLQFMADWYEERVDNKRNRRTTVLANVLKDLPIGVGVYTLSEVAFLAGTSLHNWSLEGYFSVQSTFAHLCSYQGFRPSLWSGTFSTVYQSLHVSVKLCFTTLCSPAL